MKPIKSLLLFINVVLISVVFCSSDIKERNGLLWKISGNGLAEPSYLLGTAHGGPFLSASLLLDSIPHLYDALASSKQFVGEKNIFNPANFDKGKLLVEADSSYALLLNKEDLALLDTFAVKYFHSTSDKIRLKPFYLFGAIISKRTVEKGREIAYKKLKTKKYVTDADLDEYDSISEESMDLFLQKKAYSKGFSIVGLDDIIGFRSKDTIPLTKQVEQLMYGLKNMDKFIDEYFNDPSIIAFKNAYYSQNLDEIEKQSTAFHPDSTNVINIIVGDLVYDRNLKWMDHIPQLISEKPSLIAVGVRHLPGKDGLIDLLRRKGYTVESVK